MRVKIKSWLKITSGCMSWDDYEDLPKSRVVNVVQCGSDLYWGMVKILPDVIDRRIYYVRPTVKSEVFNHRWYKLYEPKVVAGRLLSGSIDISSGIYFIEVNHCKWLDGYDWEIK